MVRKILGSAIVAALCAAPAFAQSPKVEVGVFGGWTFSDGVSGDAVIAGDGQILRPCGPDRFVPLGSAGRWLRERQHRGRVSLQPAAVQLEAGGTNTRPIGDMTFATYHGYVEYNAGDADASVRPYFPVRAGGNPLRPSPLTTNLAGQQPGLRRRHAVLGHDRRGREALSGPQRRRSLRRALDADLHQVRLRGLVVRPVLGLLRRG